MNQIDDAYLGEIRMFAGNSAPDGWSFCQGQQLDISNNTALFALLGTLYGGDGVRTFALPDLRGRVPVHAGQGVSSTFTQGMTAGQSTVTLFSNNLPAHNHLLHVSNLPGGSDSPANNFLAASEMQNAGYAHTADAESSPVALLNTGGTEAHNNLQPYLCINFIICVAGIFPARA